MACEQNSNWCYTTPSTQIPQAMKDIVLYCKSYKRDVLRAKRLVDSVERFNADQLGFFMSVPNDDRQLFENVIGRQRCEWISDEEIVSANPAASLERMYKTPGTISQQVVKSEFWRLGIADNYVCLDSDSMFIRDFKRSDFISPEGIPYTVLHQSKELLQLASNRGKQKVVTDFHSESEKAKSLFNRIGPDYDFGPPPMIWSHKVWKDLATKYLEPQGLTLWDAIDMYPAEIRWYGEALLQYESIPLLPIEPLFRFYHYDWQFYANKKLGESEEKLKPNYLGVVYQSNWQYEMDYGKPEKGLASRALRNIKRAIKLI